MSSDPPARMDRRRFLGGATALGAASLLGGCSGQGHASGDPTVVAPTSTTSSPTTPMPAASPEGALVVVTLSGGNDALNTVVPVADDRYRTLRGPLALDPDTTHDIGEGFALHPSLPASKALWDSGQLAVVHGVGFGSLDRSHFHCMDVWQAGDEHQLATGWLGRWLDTTGGDPLLAVAVDRRLPLLLRGAHTSAAVVPPGPFQLPGDGELRDLMVALAESDPEHGPLHAAAATATADLLSVVDRVAPATGSAEVADTLASRFDTVAALIEADLPTRVFALDHGGFDTHAAQPAQHAALLGELDDALGGFLQRVAQHRVTVLIYSEFGRRVAPNASLGTDHGAAGTVLVAGSAQPGSVRPGHHGDPPPLDDLTDGDLRTTVDFRSVYGALLEGVLGTPMGDVIDHGAPPLAVV